MDLFEALADPTRRALLWECAPRARRVIDLARTQEISRPAVSRHLRVLVDAGLLEAADVGRERHYRLCPNALAPLAAWVTDLAGRVTEGEDGRSQGEKVPGFLPEHVLDRLCLEVRRTVRERVADGAARRAVDAATGCASTSVRATATHEETA